MLCLNTIFRVGLTAAVVSVIAACQTTSNTNPNNLNLSDVQEAQKVIAATCIVGREGTSNYSGVRPEQVVVFGIDKGKEGWRRIDSKIEGRVRMARSNVYYNLTRKVAFCGSRSWNGSGYNSSEIF